MGKMVPDKCAIGSVRLGSYLAGIGVATLASALSVGRLMGWIQRTGHRPVEVWH